MVVISVGLSYSVFSVVLGPENCSVINASQMIEHRRLNTLMIEWSMRIDSHGNRGRFLSLFIPIL